MITKVISNFFLQIAALATFILPIIISSPAYADQKKDDIRLQISPVRQKISLKPGDKYSGSFRVSNIGLKNLHFKIYVAPYNVDGENYRPDHERRTHYNQIIDWVKIDTINGSLRPDENREINYTINVPLDVPAGSQYASLMAETINPDSDQDGSIVKATGRVGIILSAQVAGNTRYQGRLVNQSINTFFFNPPIFATSIIENTGNVGLDAKYVLKVRSFFSGSEVYSNETSPIIKEILPETKRYFSLPWHNSPKLGIFKVEQTIELLGKTETITKTVFIVPIWFIVIVILLIFAIIYHFVSRRKKS